MVLAAVIIAFVIVRFVRPCRSEIPHQRFENDVFDENGDGTIAMQNQLFDMSAAIEAGGDSLSESTKYMSVGPEITLGNDGHAHFSKNNGETGSGFANPMYAVMRDPVFPSDTSHLHDGGDVDGVTLNSSTT